jgi:hypothetical protein
LTRDFQMKTSQRPLELDKIADQVVRSAIEAMNSRNQKQWYESFSDSRSFTDDGVPHDFTEWCEAELFGASLTYLASIDKVEDAGLTIYGTFHSDQWGGFKTFLRFHVENGTITKMDVAKPTIEKPTTTRGINDGLTT